MNEVVERTGREWMVVLLVGACRGDECTDTWRGGETQRKCSKLCRK